MNGKTKQNNKIEVQMSWEGKGRGGGDRMAKFKKKLARERNDGSKGTDEAKWRGNSVGGLGRRERANKLEVNEGDRQRQPDIVMLKATHTATAAATAHQGVPFSVSISQRRRPTGTPAWDGAATLDPA